MRKNVKSYETRIITALAMIVLSGVAFIAGMIVENTLNQKPIVVKYDATFEKHVTDNAGIETVKKESVEIAKDCKYVGSRNSTKYYPPTCSFAKRIAPKNLRCFISDEDAQNKGYVRSAGC